MKESKAKATDTPESVEAVQVEAEEMDTEVVEVEAEVTETKVTEVEFLDPLEEALEAANQKVKENHDKWQRTLAEFDNYRKRSLKEKTDMYEMGVKEVVEKLLPVMDNFERAMTHMTKEDQASSIYKGVDMIYKQFQNVVKDMGIEEIQAEGCEFDLELHHAVSHEENEDYGDNQVIEVLQKGYLYKERVIRYSMVRVAN